MPFVVESRHLEGAVVLVPEVFRDQRGWFAEIYRQDLFERLGLPSTFVQENQSRSAYGVVRGLHFQWEPPMGKIMRVVVGSAFLVAVDIRKGSPTLGQWVGIDASAENGRQLWAPAGFARGFCATSETAEIQYKCTGMYNSKGESGIRWNDPRIGVRWPVPHPILSPKDETAQLLSEWLERPESNHFTYP